MSRRLHLILVPVLHLQPACGLNGAIYCLLVGATGCTCFYSMAYRTKMRKQFALNGSAYEDCHCCCQSCALTQEYIELKNRGYDLSISWVGNDAERFNRGLALAPINEPGM
ncbi:hypothetical protein MLD38_017551 [Melastoma candidum]|uniref:Uncharacterized protein n=1 Tax=Melastoma candidum TaxID=119954 RepID=A0ACB9QQZ4_9MYRT|nr:hypothetical protein MLD38_017551 [Melastoma candidum]